MKEKGEAKKVEVARVRDGKVVLRLCRVTCGKANCTRCPHGPYWYACFFNRGRWREVYVGKRLLNERVVARPDLFRKIQHLAEQEDISMGEDVRAEVLARKEAKNGELGPGETAETG
jgi:hypothetical protein